MDDDKRTLAERILDGDPGDILKRSKISPYSQPIQRLAKKADLPNKENVLRYDWPVIKKQDKVDKATITLGMIQMDFGTKKGETIKAAKPNKTKKPSSGKSKSAKSRKPKKTIKTTESTAPKKSLASIKPSDTPKSTKRKKPITPKKPTKSAAQKASSPVKNSTDTPSSFTDWLKSRKQLEGAETTLPKPPKKKAEKKKGKKKKAKTALDRNIKRSISEQDSIASVTLAELLEAQGHYKKALAMYEKLSLNNPQKSSFFAPLIQNLKNKLK